MKTEELLEKYFDGQTTCEEERTLCRLFASDQVPAHLKVYRPLFACIDREAEAFKATRQASTDDPDTLSKAMPTEKQLPRLHRLYRLTTSIAAILLLCIGIAALLPRTSTDHTCYAIIDGQYCDDPQLVQTKALEALQNVGFTDEELKETITLPNLLP